MNIRPVRLPEDRDRILGLDRAFTTDRVCQVTRTSRSFALEEVSVEPPIRKVFPLSEDDLAEGRTWGQGLVAELPGMIVGFAAFGHRRWNMRTEMSHLYVAPEYRGRGVGRALVDAAVAAAKQAGSRCLWLETSTLAFPAIQFYRRLGFELCGIDVSLYDPAWMLQGETALYFALALPSADRCGPGRRASPP